MPPAPALPVGDPLTAPYWAHVAEHRFALPRCEDCGRFHFHPRAACPHCGAARIAWVEASGRGSVYSFSVVTRAPGPAFAGETPYVIAIIATDEGPHLMSRVVDIAPEAVRIGQRVRVRFGPRVGGLELPVFGPEAAAPAG